ncbi:hypothetical protein P7K49_034069 [Saguinus oedipus]|uniref:Uncharacterized protein n=1 Tax=Saguinus oedipus TaxID=9490 RepID=A0ABQ9TVH4_SAGOE|nr:hypothetical protein P7K49_034069 [Saguinus oedipus]
MPPDQLVPPEREAPRGGASDFPPTSSQPGLTAAAVKTSLGQSQEPQVKTCQNPMGKEVTNPARSPGGTSPMAIHAPSRAHLLVALEDMAWERSQEPDQSQEQACEHEPRAASLLGQGQATCITQGSLKNWGKGLEAGVPKLCQPEHGVTHGQQHGAAAST